MFDLDQANQATLPLWVGEDFLQVFSAILASSIRDGSMPSGSLDGSVI
jgi:hypothetical protein